MAQNKSPQNPPADGAKKNAFKPLPKAPPPPRRKTDVFAILVSGLVIGVLIVGLWISVNAVIEKMRLAQGLRRIIDIVSTAREMSVNDRTIGQKQEDLVAMLERLGRDTPTGTSGDLKALTNPWGGVLLATIVPAGHVHIETVVPPYVCRRMTDLFGQDTQALGVELIEVRGAKESWRMLYSKASPAPVGEAAINAACGSSAETDIALTFSLR